MGKSIQKLQVVIPAGQVLFKEGDQSKEMYILLKGSVEVLKGEDVIATIDASGSFIGEMATLLNAPRTAHVRTKEKSVFLKVEPQDVDVLFKVTPELGYNLSKSLAERLVTMTDKALGRAHGMPAHANAGPDTSVKPTAVDVAAAEQAVQVKQEPPKDPAQAVAFLTRTEVHKDVMRHYFNNVGATLPLVELAHQLGCPEALVAVILGEFPGCGLAKVEGDKLEYIFLERLMEAVEEWIFANGLFRRAV